MIVGNLGAAYEREIQRKPINNVIFFGGFAILTLLIVFLFGIRPTAIALAQNSKYKSELEQIRDGMLTKLSQIETESLKINQSATGVTKLNKAIPDDVYMQEFLEELVVKSAGTGFVIQRVKQNDISGNEIPLDLEMAGPLTGVGGLLENIEGMERFVNIMDIRLDTEGPIATLKFRVIIYKL